MRNLTVSLPEGVLDRLRVLAAERKQSVNRFVGDVLREVTSQTVGNWQAEHSALFDTIPELRSEGPWKREDLYEERLR